MHDARAGRLPGAAVAHVLVHEVAVKHVVHTLRVRGHHPVYLLV